MDWIQRLHEAIDRYLSLERLRKENLLILHNLYKKLQIDQKVPNYEEIFHFNAINVTGISLQKDQLLQVQLGKYLQIIGIKKIDNRSKNISLRYFGKIEKIDPQTIEEVGEFVLRWRLEKSFLGVENYKELLSELLKKRSLE